MSSPVLIVNISDSFTELGPSQDSSAAASTKLLWKVSGESYPKLCKDFAITSGRPTSLQMGSNGTGIAMVLTGTEKKAQQQ